MDDLFFWQVYGPAGNSAVAAAATAAAVSLTDAAVSEVVPDAVFFFLVAYDV